MKNRGSTSTRSSRSNQQRNTSKTAEAVANASPVAKANPVAASKYANIGDMAERDKNEVLGAIREMNADFSQKFRDVMTGINGIQAELRLQSARISEAEERLGKVEDEAELMHTCIKTLQEKCTQLEERVDDQENRARRNNLRIIGLPEKVEGRDMCGFLEDWLPKTLGENTFPTPLVIERAHRIGRPPVGQNANPRVVIMKFLNYKDKERATRAARAMKTVRFENNNVRFYPDFSAEINRQQKLFDPVKKQLQALGVRYGMFYPAILVVTHNGQQHPFKDVLDAEAFVTKLKTTGGAAEQRAPSGRPTAEQQQDTSDTAERQNEPSAAKKTPSQRYSRDERK